MTNSRIDWLRLVRLRARRWNFALVLALCLLGAAAAADGANAEKTRELAAVLQSNASLFEKARACQQLGEIGTPEAVPALAALLGDEHLSAYARSGLEGIADPSAAAALRAALGTVQGNLLAGVINSLGVLRDSQSVPALRALAENPASGVSSEALLALGRIANRESMQVLRKTLGARQDALRADAAAGCLLAAEKQLSDGHAKTAVALNDAVRAANVPPVYRSAATRGAILARQSGAVKFLMKQLQGDDPVSRTAALLTIREMPGPELADALNAQIGNAGHELKLQLLGALADCHNDRSLELLEDKATSGGPEVRKTALKVLARVAGPGQAGIFVRIILEDRSEDETALAESALERMEGGAINDLVSHTLESARDAHARVQLIGLLENRGATDAVPELFKQAADPDTTVSLAAFDALGSLAAPTDMAALIVVTKACKDESARDAAEKAICRAAANNGSSNEVGAVVLTELEHSVEPAEKNEWVRILASLGSANALPAIESATKDSNETVAANAIESLRNWPDPAPIDALLAVIDTGTNPALRLRAFASMIQLAMTAVDDRQRSDAVVVGWLERANPAAQSVAERRQLISILARLKRPESFRMLSQWLDQPDLRNEAELAVIQIAPALMDSEDSAALKTALEKIAASADNPDIRTQAAKLAQSPHGAQNR